MRNLWLFGTVALVAYISTCNAFVSDLAVHDDFEALIDEDAEFKPPPHDVLLPRVKRSGKGHSSSFDEGGGSKKGEDHHSKKGESGKKGHHASHKWDKADKGHHDKSEASGAHEEKGGHKKESHDEGGGYKKHDEAGGHKKGGKKGHKKHHKKGSKTSGFHHKKHKDEYHKDSKFWDDHHKEGELCRVLIVSSVLRAA